MSWYQTVLPVGTLVLGSLLTMASDSRGDARRRRAQRDDDARAHELALRDRRESFELSNLLEVQAALNDVGRYVTRIHLFDRKTAKTTGHYAGTLIDDNDLDEETRLGYRRLFEARLLIIDDNLRTRVEAAQAALGRPASLLRATVEEGDQAYEAAMLAARTASHELAARIREIYRGPGSSGV